jgi:hypothetical protein
MRSKSAPRIRYQEIRLPGSNRGKKLSSVSRTNQDHKAKEINSKVMKGLGGKIEVRIEVKVATTDVIKTAIFTPN